ncbi:MAG: tannase/feruloyl esterase family alpha/beta hydrolase [Novosphingobium sp.]|nr:tannase/feruloyl esterase family alpha/beta hydrolase [Novosphingobium sp.]
MTLPGATLSGFHDDGVCVVRGTLEGRIGFELRLPDAWNGRYYQIGTGGFAGTIFPESLAWEAAKGNAAAMTDAGHRGEPMDARWAAGDARAVEDYGHRSIRLLSDAAAALIAGYYGRPARYRYFAGCSNGGRQALMAAQRYPTDWDGIVAGAPANLWTRQLTSFAELQGQLAQWPPLDAAMLAQVQREALATCPRRTVERGVALRPLACKYRPRDPRVAAIAAAGYEPTSASSWSGWAVPDPAGSSAQVVFAENAFRYLLGNDPAWTVRDGARPIADRTRRTLDADARDFSQFRKRGGKIVSYFGWADPLIAPRPHLDWQHSLRDSRDFYRLFMVPGMSHCQGGGVPDAFGQSPASPAAAADPQHDIRAALEAWVETDRTPERLVAVRWQDGRIVERRTLRPQ